ncbi:MAG: carbohydrate ABC transporter permease [Puniceicoccales bacterium]|nr:carbohydrate ABC transporter permease [Puniceicoccales bacterium]
MALLTISAFLFLPQLWMINTALKPGNETFSLYFFTGPLTLDNFKRIITDPQILTYLKNSLTVSFASSFFATIVSAFAGYSFSKFRYRGRKLTMSLFMMSQAFPHAILLISIYLLMQRLGLLGSYSALLISYVTFTLPVGTWTLKGYFDGIPNALIESAKIDGASQFRILFQIVMPLAIPGLISIAIYGFVWSWNDLLYSLTLITDASKRTLAPGLIMTFKGEFTTNWGNMMAASVFVSIPVTLVFIFLQRYFIHGLTSGAVKE